MKLAFAIVMLAACGGLPAKLDMTADGAVGSNDPLAGVFAAVDKDQIRARLDELTGATQLTAGGRSFALTNRWAPTAKADFRAYYRDYMEALGATVVEQTFPIGNLVGETQGHNIEATLPGASADSLVILVHYDTVGITGKETQNPGADDDGSGLAMMMEAARIFATRDRANTVRFVAADYEEISDDLDGDYAYVAYLQQEAQTDGFRILAASDDDQTGWSCWSEGLCGTNPPPTNTTFQMISCSGDSHHYDYPDLAKGITEIAQIYNAAVTPTTVCDGSGDTDHYPFWVAGIPAYVLEEYGSENNPHYDDTGDDTMAHIDLDLLHATSQVQITFQAKLAGVTDR